jgi:hypothetical protein
MSFLLDTNVVSEWVRPVPDEHVIAWLDAVDEDRVFVSVATFAEIRRGIELLPLGRRRARLTDWLAGDVPRRFEDRVIDIDQRIAEAWGVTMARSHALGATLGTMDAFFVATALVHDLTLVTRNVRDFEATGIALLNPWQAAP